MVFATQSFIDNSMWLIGLAMIFYAITDFATQYSMYKKYGELEIRAAEEGQNNIEKIENGDKDTQ